MKYVRLLAVLPILFLLVGCGGGGGGGASVARTTKITIHVQWPTATRAKSRAIPASTAFLFVEAFVGNSRIGTALLHRDGSAAGSSATISVPQTGVTFFATAFAKDPTNDPSNNGQVYVTNPATGLLTNGGTAPLDPAAGNQPLGRAVNSVTILDTTDPANQQSPGQTNQTITFTFNNAIATFVPVTAPTDLTVLTVGSGPVDLNTRVQAKDANGATVIVDPTDLVWSKDTTDPTFDSRILIAADGHTATLSGTGPVRLIVKDVVVNGPSDPSAPNLGQVPIQATVGFTIIPSAGVTIALDTAALSKQTPLYAKSVRLTLTETAFPQLDANGQPLDSPQPPIVKTVNTMVLNPANLSDPDPTRWTIGVPAVSITYPPSGRPFMLTVQAFSGQDGDGILIAQTKSRSYSSVNDPSFTADFSPAGGTFTYTPALFAAGDYQPYTITVAPSTASIFFFDPASGVVSEPGQPNTVTLNAFISKSGVAPQSIDSRTVVWATGTVSPLGPAPVALSPALPAGSGEVVTSIAVTPPITTPTAVVITATDAKASILTGAPATVAGSSTVTVQDTKPTFNIH